jgi:hypothetical protein
MDFDSFFFSVFIFKNSGLIKDHTNTTHPSQSE